MIGASGLEEQQETNLHQNWQFRKAHAQVIAHYSDYDVVVCRQFGVAVFYIVQNDTPLGYVHCYEDGEYIQINSTYISPSMRRKGLASVAYKAIILTVKALVSDNERSDGAEAVWQKLKADPALHVRDNGENCWVARSR